ncbi:MAG TPA: DUF6268 family outer membrane beta-barrel protein [Chlamydiales bacterium]|jgi:hypothetical protein|nr:DUF6268 family outer membrane beta-barrel protein [Chlamydiales bacterium]
MRRFFLLLLLSCSLYSQEEQQFSYWDIHPIHAGGNLLRLGQANVTDTDYGGDIYYRKSNVFLYMLVPISMKSYFFPRVEWNTFTLNWNKNPKFNQTHFYYVQFALTFYTSAIENWRWIARGEYNLDTEHFNNPSQYGLFTGLLWGAYQIHRKWHYHVGGVGYGGIGGQQVYPIIGADYAPNKYWTFQFVFPIEYFIEYKLDDHWRFSVRGRPLKERFRTGKNQPQPRSLFSYSSIGTEFNVKYEKFMHFEIEAYGGCNFGGSFYIKDEKGKNAIYTDVGASPYGGLSLNYGF